MYNVPLLYSVFASPPPPPSSPPLHGQTSAGGHRSISLVLELHVQATVLVVADSVLNKVDLSLF